MSHAGIEGIVPSSGSPAAGTGGMPNGRAPNISEIREIIAIDDPVVRNRRISLCYHDLSRAMQLKIADGNADWPAFAAWASETAGTLIRKPDIGKFLVSMISDRNAPKLPWTNAPFGAGPEQATIASRLLLRMMNAVSAATAEGNLEVFRDIAPACAAWIQAMNGKPTPDRNEFRDRLAPLLRELRDMDDDAADLLDAMMRYWDASQMSDPVLKDQYVLYANALIGYREQRRLQPFIRRGLISPLDEIWCGAGLRGDGEPEGFTWSRAMKHPISTLAQFLLYLKVRLVLAVSNFPRQVRNGLGKVLNGAETVGIMAPLVLLHRVLRFLRLERLSSSVIMPAIKAALNRTWLDYITRNVTLRIDDLKLQLDRDLTDHNCAPLPPTLKEKSLNSCAARSLPELVTMLVRYDAYRDVSPQSGARNWASLRERMEFILVLFRRMQRDCRTLACPFTLTVANRIRSGTRLPSDCQAPTDERPDADYSSESEDASCDISPAVTEEPWQPPARPGEQTDEFWLKQFEDAFIRRSAG